MKNLFKNLMLVAVAAMAFVACSQEGNEVNILAKETTFEFTAGFNEDTRSGFGEKEGDAYPSVWNGGESIIAIFSNEDGVIGSAYSSIDDLGEGVESSKTATFTVKYEGSLPDNYSVTFYSGSWYTNYETGEAYYYISDNQRCTDTSVESSNHLCKTEAIEVVNGEISTLNLTFNTATAFGKVTMEQFSDIADKIEEVKVTINENTTYTVTPNALTKPVVWFACEAIESVTSLIVEAKVDGVTYIKTKEDIAEGALSFNTGRIRPINVKDMTEKPADYTFAFDSCVAINAYEGYWGGENYYAFKFTNSNNNQEWYLGFSAEDITNDTLPIGTFEVTNNMEQGKVYGNGSFLLNIDEFNNEYPTYLTEGTVTISENEGVYNVLAKVKAYVNGSRTIDISFEGTIAEPELPTFTSAIITNAAMDDKLVQFTSDELGTLQLNFYNCNNNNWIDARTYTFANSGEIYPGGSYSWYKDIDGTQHYAVNGTVVVTIVNGKYHIEFSNITDYDGSYTLNAVYEGEIEGLIVPDLREPLATPEPTFVLDGKTATISWESIPGAVAYRVFTQNNELNETITETSITLNFVEYGEYYINVKAVAATDDATYRDSEANFVRVFIEDTRVRLELSNISATASGNTVTISWDPVEGAGSYTVTFNGNPQNTTDTEVVFTDLEYNKDYYYNVVANPANEETHRASYASSGYVKTERDPNAGYSYDLTFATCEAGAGNTYTFTTDDGSYEWKLKLQDKLAVGSFVNEQWNDAYWVGNDTEFSYPGMSYPAYIYNGTLDISLDGDIYTIVLTSYDIFENGVKFTYTGAIEEYVSTGIDLSDYIELKDVTVTWSGSSVVFRSSSPYTFYMNLYGVNGILTEGTYLATGVPTFDSASLEGFSAGDDRVANVYLNDDGSYTITVEGSFSYAGYMKVYFTITL